MKLVLCLPIILTKFFEPLPLSKEDFFGRWLQVTGAPGESVVIVKATSRAVDLAYVSKVLTTAFHLAVLANTDPNPNNLVASGTFFSTSKQVVCMARLESNPQVSIVFACLVRLFFCSFVFLFVLVGSCSLA